jgi:uncharacterized protein YbcI
MSADSAQKARGSTAAQISNGVVHALAETIGRGPTKARTHISEDLIAVVLRDYMTKSERALVDDGSAEIVLDGRRAIQECMRSKLIEVVEGASGREVESFFSDNLTTPDIAVEIFVLVPLPQSGHEPEPPVEHRDPSIVGTGGAAALADQATAVGDEAAEPV